MTEVDPSLPMLLDPDGNGRAYHLLRRSIHSYTGQRALLVASHTPGGDCFSTPLAIVSPFTTGDAVWCGRSIDTGQRLPDTVLDAMIGRPASDVVDHRAAHGRRIDGTEIDDDGHAVIRMDERTIGIAALPGVTRRLRMTTTARIAVDRVTDVLVWLRLRHGARRRDARSNLPCGGPFGFSMVTALFATSAFLLAWIIGIILTMRLSPETMNTLGMLGVMVMLALPLASSACAGIAYARWRAFPYRARPREMLQPPWLRPDRDDI